MTPNIHDAGAGERQPDPPATEAAVILAAKAFAQLDDRLREYRHARSGHAYEQLLTDWRASRTALVEAARATSGETP